LFLRNNDANRKRLAPGFVRASALGNMTTLTAAIARFRSATA
jgi:hypothetical protein